MTKKLLCETPGDDEDNLSDCPRSQARSIGPQTSNVDRLGPQLRRLPVRVIAFMVLASIVASPFGDSFAPSGIALGQSADFELAPINYLDAPVSDPVAKLSEQLEAGEAKLKWDRERGYLPAVLEAARRAGQFTDLGFLENEPATSPNFPSPASSGLL